MRSLLILLLLQTVVFAQDIPAYKNSTLPVEERVADLLPRMTLEEKVAQLTSTMEMLGFNSDAQASFVDKEGSFLPERAAGIFKHGIGQISRPGGRLPLSVPRSAGQLPVFYNHKPTARRGYVASTPEPLYPFGWGLSYTTFKYENIGLAPNKIGGGNSVNLIETTLEVADVALNK